MNNANLSERYLYSCPYAYMREFKINWTAVLSRASHNQILAKTDDIHE